MALKERKTGNTAQMTAQVGLDLYLGHAQGIGVTIDNYSNQWLTVGTEKMFVPPFTLGWATNLMPTASSIPVRVGNPPGLAIPTSRTDGAVIASLYDEFISPSNGSQYNEVKAAQNLLTFADTWGTPFTTGIVLLNGFGGVQGSQFQVIKAGLVYDSIAKGAGGTQPCSVDIQFNSSSSPLTLDIVAGAPTCFVDLNVEAIASGVPGRINFTAQSFGAGTEDVFVTFIFQVNAQ